jgi:pyruvate/2-oxoglutarate dehydrogenase complex dihydrolipoamide acyltransferase (E2) component
MTHTQISYVLRAEPGDHVEVDEPIAQIETDKVLSEMAQI